MRGALPRAVPRGYALHRVGPTWLILDTRMQRELIELRLADPDSRGALFARAQHRGRGQAPSVQLRDGDSLVLRRYRHGGLLGWLTRTWLWGPGRALREFDVTVRAERSDAPVPHVACVVSWPVLGPLWSALIGTVEIERGEDLLGWIRRLSERADRIRLAHRVGASIRRLHDTGIAHRDLQLRNILVRWNPSPPEPPEVVVIDLDRASHHPQGVPLLRRAANLGRLARSAVKLGLWDQQIGKRERAAFVAGYLGRDRALRRALRHTVALERIKLGWHRLGYRAHGTGAVRQASSGCASSTSIAGMPSAIGKRSAQAGQSRASC